MIEDERKPAWMRWGGAALGLMVVVLVVLWLRDMLLSGKPSKTQTVQQITLLRPPPPPPPPPKPPEQKPPEVKEEVKLEEPKPTPEPEKAEAPPPGPDLAIDAEGTGSGDGFGLVGKKGGADLIGGGGGKGNPWAWYDALVNEAVNAAFQAALAREKALKNKNYKVVVKVWIDASGQVTRTALVDSTGDSNVDEILKEALKDMRALRDGPPADMPQPMKIRVTSRA